MMILKLCVAILFFIAATESVSIISRSVWGARNPKVPAKDVTMPLSMVIIHHSAGSSCYSKANCISSVKSIQNNHMDDKKWNDIGFNFVIGEDGNVYEGVGWNKYAAESSITSSRAASICVIGSFNKNAPNAAAISAVKSLIEQGVSQGKLSKMYQLVGHLQLRQTDCPGSSFYSVIKGWPHWVSKP